MQSLHNKTALITGASSGIGAQTAKHLVAAGAKVILMARRQDRLLALAQTLQEEQGGRVFILEADVRDQTAVAEALHTLPKLFREIDILINNAGLAAGQDKIVDALLEDWDAMIDTNLKGLMYVTRAILPLMQARNSGHIVNISSLAGHVAYPGGSIYCASKSAVKAFTRAIKLECEGSPIRVTEIAPGLTETEFSTVRFKGDAARAKKVYENLTPLSAEDIAESLLYTLTRPLHVNISEMVIVATEQKIQLN